MAGSLNVKVIMAKCSKTRKAFGVRIEQRRGVRARTWGFSKYEISIKTKNKFCADFRKILPVTRAILQKEELQVFFHKCNSKY